MSDEKANKLALPIGLLLFAVAVVAAIFFNRPLLEKQRRMDQRRNELKLEVARQRQEIDEMSRKSLRFESDPEFVERQARLNHRIRPGETEYIFDAPE